MDPKTSQPLPSKVALNMGRMKRLLPLTPIFEEPRTGHRSRASNTTADILKVDSPRRYTPNAARSSDSEELLYAGSPQRQYHEHQWTNRDVQNVVNRYLTAVKFGSYPVQAQQRVFCKCCIDRNQENTRKRLENSMDPFERGPQDLDLDLDVESLPPLLAAQPGALRGLDAPRSESNELHSESQYVSSTQPFTNRGTRSGPSGSSGQGQHRAGFLTHPAKQELYKLTNPREPEDPYKHHMAEDLVEASSKYNLAMNRLNRTIHDLDSGQQQQATSSSQ